MNEVQRVDIIGVGISVVNFKSALSYLFDNFDKARGNYICAANVHTTVTAHEDESYKTIQNNSFLTLPDGMPLSVVGKKRGYSRMGRVTGPDFLEEVLRKTANTEYRHYFYGTTQNNLNAFLDKAKELFPELNIAGAEPSVFRPLSEKEEDAFIGPRMHATIAAFSFAAFFMKGEYWGRITVFLDGADSDYGNAS